MIVTCPTCSARYRLSDEAVARGSRLKCGACGERWVPHAEVEPPSEPAPVAPPIDAGEHSLGAPAVAVAEPIAAPKPAFAGPATAPVADEGFAATDDEEPEPSHLARNIVALVAGTALAVAAFGLWGGQIDTSRIPSLAPLVTAFAPQASPLKVALTGVVSPLPSGGQVLEINGTISNTGRSVATVPLLKASLAGAGGPVRRWTISPAAARLGPGEQLSFTSTVTGFPADARTLSVTPGR